ncbi:conserved hypothetical protein [Thermotomaculum hydrothermale]|uniref:Uncharacterized protein n=1 Tax=Thermotomaculum hydrothermale TaxID=981385 RepID=A0A7R6PTD7_9BACT|nr:hypothetical protein [Thermotomaculum hydrothermale]BBB32292.1 conserved hypothetical protein [Thermotomaculum hydrothermale]
MKGKSIAVFLLFFLLFFTKTFAQQKYIYSYSEYASIVQNILDGRLKKYEKIYPTEFDVFYDLDERTVKMHINLLKPPYMPDEELIQNIEDFENKYGNYVTSRIFYIYLIKENFYYTPDLFKYYGMLTMDTQTTFKERMGNCFSLTNMFITITRELGFNSYYYLVSDINSTYLSESTLIRTVHIVCGIDINYPRPYIIDFLPQEDIDYKRLFRLNRVKKLTDIQAAGLFYNNIACKYMMERDYGFAKYLLEFADSLYPDSGIIKNNLAVIYKKNGQYADSIKTFLEALKYAPSFQFIIANILKLESKLPEKDRAEIDNLLENEFVNNYYWHLLKANEYLSQKKFKKALKEIKKADKLSQGNQEVYIFYYRLGVLTRDSKLIEKYSNKINLLENNNKNK